MTPEAAAYHRLMIMVGLRDRFDAEVDQALETEDPITAPVLDLACYLSDTNKVISILHEFTLDHSIDDQAVVDMVFDDLRNRYLAGELSRAEVAHLMYRISQNSDEHFSDPWEDLRLLPDDLELLGDGMISEEVFNTCFDAYLLRGQWLNPLMLEPSKPVLPGSYRSSFAAMIVMIVLSFAAIAAAVALTGGREMADFTRRDWIIWFVYLAAEISIVALELFFAFRCGRLLKQTHPKR